MGWFGLGKKRSSFGKWLDQRGIRQTDVVIVSGVSKSTVSRLCSDDGFKPNVRTESKLIRGLKKIDPSFSTEVFW